MPYVHFSTSLQRSKWTINMRLVSVESTLLLFLLIKNFLGETVVTKWDRKQLSKVIKVYYKIHQVLQSVTEVYYKVRQVLQSVTEVYYKYVRYYKLRQVLQSVTGCYYKVHQIFQSVTVVTKWDVTILRLLS